jgi:hypothetical protein
MELGTSPAFDLSAAPMLFPGGMSTADALKIVERVRLPSFSECESYLEGWLNRGTLMKLYRRLFPKEFRTSRASNRMPDDGGYSAKEKEFFGLVEKNCFDMGVMWEDERSDWIPYYLQGISYYDVCEEENFVSFLPGLRFAISLSWSDAPKQPKDLLPEALRAKCPEKGEGVMWSSAFERRCRKEGGAARGFPALMRYVGKDTGNPLLDMDEESNTEPLEWSEENVLLLRRLHRWAGRYFQRVNRTCQYLERYPTLYLKLIRLWNASLITQAEANRRWNEHEKRRESRRAARQAAAEGDDDADV